MTTSDTRQSQPEYLPGHPGQIDLSGELDNLNPAQITELKRVSVPQEANDADWTVDPESGRSNSSREFLTLIDEVARLIRGGTGQCLDPRWAHAASRTILAQLAHVHGLAPASHRPDGNIYAYRCPTPCDPDCEHRCHEGHEVSYKQRHNVAECQARHAAAETYRRFAPITPEDEGIATTDVHAQQQANARAYCPDCGHPETNCACG